uniref:tripartite tricarboxylate transporter TctB family protein n=1 Tax=Pararhizobium sp. IMCC3301 TaxID=3067904 RepID=UPI002740C32B|nr:tripartite tricarboxylate transporter TctB family protein [Pararhizobium sp. IMCC3301]
MDKDPISIEPSALEPSAAAENTGAMTSRNRISGGVLVVVGLYVVIESLSYDLGTLARMGPGFLPLVLGILILVFGLLIALVNEDGDELASGIVWRPVVLVLSAMLAFALLLEPAGLAAATAALVFVSGISDPDHNWRSLLMLFVVLLAAVWVIFGVVLGIPFQLITGIL